MKKINKLQDLHPLAKVGGWFTFALVGTALLVVLLGWLCGPKGVDLAREITPVAQASESEQKILDSLKAMSPEQRAKAVRENFPDLEKRLIIFLHDPRLAKHVGQFKEIKRIDYVYGSLNGVKATDGSGQLHDGYIQDELIAQIYLDDKKEPFNIIVRCSNGLFEVPGVQLESIYSGTPVTEFTIQHRGESLCDYVDFRTSIMLAETFHLQIMKKDLGSRRYVSITPTQAFSLENTTDRTLVKVEVYQGDRFNLAEMTYNGQPAPTN